jgi:Flp pilus assembly protein TadB
VSVLGALLAGVAVAGLTLALAPPSRIARRLELLAPRPSAWDPSLRRLISPETDPAGSALAPARVLALKLISACAAGLLLAVVSLGLAIGPAGVAVAAYLGWLVPSLVLARQARLARRQAHRASVVLVERLFALVAAGRPPEAALASLLLRSTGSTLLDRTAARVTDSYLLGAPLFRTLGAVAREAGLTACRDLADDLERSRDLGTGSVALLRERREVLRRRERSDALEAASTVEGKLMLVLTLCYLPALLLLVVVPLFLSLLRGLGA